MLPDEIRKFHMELSHRELTELNLVPHREKLGTLTSCEEDFTFDRCKSCRLYLKREKAMFFVGLELKG